ncbi:REX4, RNA exonuclease 4 [Cichlidogyrus casuarinus]|uniref:RNA exonuclease 4 n=1 Tax=Cichlidogyrus casuarinus TaxID=1844966 RepID=A0ABD2QBV5_9PLAT
MRAKPERNDAAWIDGVSKTMLSASKSEDSKKKTLVLEKSTKEITRCVAIDCEFVGVGFQGQDDELARVSIVNLYGHVLMDYYVRPREQVVDYRSKFSGIHPHHFRPDGPAKDYQFVHNEVAKALEGRILVGHSVRNDLRVLNLSHPKSMIRDTSRYKPFRRLFKGQTPSLKRLTKEFLKIDVQDNEHDSIQDAQATMRLYTAVKRDWEFQIKSHHSRKFGKMKTPSTTGTVEAEQKNPPIFKYRYKKKKKEN